MKIGKDADSRKIVFSVSMSEGLYSEIRVAFPSGSRSELICDLCRVGLGVAKKGIN